MMCEPREDRNFLFIYIMRMHHVFSASGDAGLLTDMEYPPQQLQQLQQQGVRNVLMEDIIVSRRWLRDTSALPQGSGGHGSKVEIP